MRPLWRAGRAVNAPEKWQPYQVIMVMISRCLGSG